MTSKCASIVTLQVYSSVQKGRVTSIPSTPDTSTVNELVDIPSTQELTWSEEFWLSRPQAPMVMLIEPNSRAPIESGQPVSPGLQDCV